MISRSPFIVPLADQVADLTVGGSQRRLASRVDGNGAMWVRQVLAGGAPPPFFDGGADAQAVRVPADLNGVTSWGHLFNGATWDRARGVEELTLLAAAVRAATVNSADFVNFNGRGLVVVFNVSAVPGVQTVTLELQGRDALSGLYYTILSSAAIVGVSTTVLRIYPATAPVANIAADHPLPRIFRARVVHSGAGNFTYSVGASVAW